MADPTLAPAALPCQIGDLLQPGSVKGHFCEQVREVDAVPTPFESLNRECRDEGGGVGLARGWYDTFGANTGTGKSLLALNFAARAIEHGEQVAFLSIEMSRTQVATRLYAIITGTDVRELERGGSFSPDAAKQAAFRIAELRERTGASFYMNLRPIFRLDAVQGLMTYFHQSKGCRFFIVDYLQLLGTRDADTLYAQVSNVSARVREFANQLNVIAIGISQFNRQTSSNYADRPQIQGLMGGSSLENDSDQVVLLDHTRVQHNKESRTTRTWMLLEKNRHGGRGNIPIEWDYRTLRVREAKPDEEGEWP